MAERVLTPRELDHALLRGARRDLGEEAERLAAFHA